VPNSRFCDAHEKVVPRFRRNYCLAVAFAEQQMGLPTTRQALVYTNASKRLELYKLAATGPLETHGRGNRVELPKCLVRLIRNIYPDAAYTGFQEHPAPQAP